MKMSQPGTDKGLKGETGERIPKGARASDEGGEKHVRGASSVDSTKGKPGQTGERIPNATASDRTGEKKEGITGGVGMGQHDALTGREGSHAGKHDGQVGEFNEGRSDGNHYTHNRRHSQHDGY